MDIPCLLSLVRWIDSIEEDKEFVCPFFVFGLMREGFGGEDQVQMRLICSDRRGREGG